MRRLETKAARAALARAGRAAPRAYPCVDGGGRERISRSEHARGALIASGKERLLLLEEVEALLASKALVVDACRHVVRHGHAGLAGQASGVVRARAGAWRSVAARRAGMRSSRAYSDRSLPTNRIARDCESKSRLRRLLRTFADVSATKRGFALLPRRAREVVVLARPITWTKRMRPVRLACRR